jgi:type III pantothenate kinase
MIKLTIDEGNTTTKLALFDDKELLTKEMDVSNSRCLELASECDRLILSSVKKDSQYKLSIDNKRLLVLDSNTPIPISNTYNTPHSLGNDRIALAVGAHEHFPNHNVLAIDAGTCITYDFVNAQSEYIGGGISAGIQMRYTALHQFTSQLPLLSPLENPPLTGKDPAESIHSGVINGIISEIDGIIQRYSEQHPEIRVIATGGDAKFFDKGLKNTIFANPNLLMEGLNKILDYNESYF